MRKGKKAKSATIALVILWLLIGLSNISVAENIPISKEGLEQMGLNKVRLESGIGVIVFNLSESSDCLKASGYLTLSNTYNASATITCRIITRLSVVDLNEDGNPRLHKTISNNIIFFPIPDDSWITLEDEKAAINPHSIYNFRYTVDIPLNEGIVFDNNEGYLLYINVKKTIENATGANIGIDYNYKLFLIFTGELKQGIVFSTWMIVPIPVILITGTSLAIYKKKHHKKPKTTTNTKAIEIPDRVVVTETYRETPTASNKYTDIHQKIDHLLDNADTLQRRDR